MRKTWENLETLSNMDVCLGFLRGVSVLSNFGDGAHGEASSLALVEHKGWRELSLPKRIWPYSGHSYRPIMCISKMSCKTQACLWSFVSSRAIISACQERRTKWAFKGRRDYTQFRKKQESPLLWILRLSL